MWESNHATLGTIEVCSMPRIVYIIFDTFMDKK